MPAFVVSVCINYKLRHYGHLALSSLAAKRSVLTCVIFGWLWPACQHLCSVIQCSAVLRGSLL